MNPPCTILIVDDEPELLSVMAQSLRLLGFSAQTAVNATDALDILRAQKTDFVICDLVMPGMGGVRLHELAKSSLPHSPPFLFCTGLNEMPLQPPYPAGVVGFLQKPFSVNELLLKIESN